MKVLMIFYTVILASGITSAALADKYDSLAARRYRWITSDGTYGFRSREDLRKMVQERGERGEFALIEELRAYYLIPGTIVQVIQEDPSSGTSQIQLKRVSRPLWTLSRFLSSRPVTNLDKKIETPF